MKKLWQKFKKLIIKIAAPLLSGTVIGLVTKSSIYKLMNKPTFSPPGFVFPIVWTILYVLMGISSYLVDKSVDVNKDKALKIYYAQLIMNLIWPILFFNFKLYFVSFLWIIALVGVVSYMIVNFYKVDKKAAYLQLPYLFWIIFASILNYYIYLYN